MIDSKKRTIVKAITWKVIGFLILSGVTYLATGSIVAASIVSLIYHVIQFATYMIHERVWSRIKFGKTKGLFIQMTGLSGAGKTTLARAVAARLHSRGIQVEVIDGDEYRNNLCSDLGFSKEDRNTNIRRLGFVGKVLAKNSVVSLMSAINPYDDIRQEVKRKTDAKLVYVRCSIDEVIKRDTKGLYARALLPDGDPLKVNNFTGISDPFENPTNVDLIIDTDTLGLRASVDLLEKFIMENI